jgi:hypothetical protein
MICRYTYCFSIYTSSAIVCPLAYQHMHFSLTFLNISVELSQYNKLGYENAKDTMNFDQTSQIKINLH